MEKYFSIFVLGSLIACSPAEVQFKDKNFTSDVGQALITINNGAAFTNNKNVKVQINSPQTTEMIISDDPDCKSAQGYISQAIEIQKTLSRSNTVNTIYAKFRNKFKIETPCVAASIVHDDIPPSIRWKQRPNGDIATDSALLDTEASDQGSGIENFECSWEDVSFSVCNRSFEIKNMPNRRHKLKMRVVDRANNYSEPVSADWFVDTTPPVVEITKMPPSQSRSRDATFEFVGRDEGTGILKYICSINGNPVNPCSSPISFTRLADGTYNFGVSAVDRVGNTSTPARYTFEVDNVVSGAFSILGLTSASPTHVDETIDSWLSSPVPRVHYTESTGARNYKVEILKSTGQTACSEINSALLTASFSADNCQLSDNSRFTASVTAVDSAGNLRTQSFLFVTDMTPPQINIVGPAQSNNNLTARFDFTVTDTAPGVLANVNCFHSYQDNNRTVETQQSCDSIRSLTFNNLSFGMHEFKVVAKDAAGNSAESRVPWRVLRTICDPFADENSACNGGLIGELFYLNRALQEDFKDSTKRVQFFFDRGIRLDAEINLQKLFSPTRKFNQGFPTSDGSLIKDDRGNNLIEYFALKLNTVIKLDTDNADPLKRDESGTYQLATLSDDGSVVRILKNGNWVEWINNDSDHSTRLECAADTLFLDSNSRIGLQLDYYQGPREFIALNLIWRKVENNTPPEFLCGSSGNDFFFGPDPYNNFVDFGWGRLVERGWKPLTDQNFIRPR